jgi:hypothetical protein
MSSVFIINLGTGKTIVHTTSSHLDENSKPRL